MVLDNECKIEIKYEILLVYRIFNTQNNEPFKINIFDSHMNAAA